MQNGDETLLSIILAGWSLLVKMLITHVPQHIFWSNFAYLYIFLIGSQNDKEKNIKNTTRPPLVVYYLCLSDENCMTLARPWHRILINLRSAWVVHIKVSWLCYLTLHAGKVFIIFCRLLNFFIIDFFSKLTFSKNSFSNTIRLSKS